MTNNNIKPITNFQENIGAIIINIFNSIYVFNLINKRCYVFNIGALLENRFQ